jgi:hydroxyacylglutathione hydrolase
MIVKRFFEPLIAQASYLIGCAASGQAIVIDPHRDTALYLAAAAADQLQITHVTETHIHADFLGSRRAQRRRALPSPRGRDADWLSVRDRRLIRNGDRFDRQRGDRRRAHAGTHARASFFVITDGAVVSQLPRQWRSHLRRHTGGRPPARQHEGD